MKSTETISQLLEIMTTKMCTVSGSTNYFQHTELNFNPLKYWNSIFIESSETQEISKSCQSFAIYR